VDLLKTIFLCAIMHVDIWLATFVSF